MPTRKTKPVDNSADLFDTAQVADNFNINKSTVQGWVADGCPVAVPGKPGRSHLFDIAKVRAWRAQKVGKLDPMAERARKDKLTADGIEIRNQMLLGTLLDREAVEHHVGGMLAAARAKLLALPTRLATMAVAADTLEAVEHGAREIIIEALNELAGSVIPPADDLEATAGPDSKPVGGPVQKTKPGGISGTGSVAD